MTEKVFISEDDLANVITAKAAVCAACKVLLERLNLRFSDINRLFLAGGFGNYIDRENAVKIGLLPSLPLSAIEYAGNTSIWGAKIAALSRDAYDALRRIGARTTYFDLMGCTDYVEQFKRAMFIPHTDVELFQGALSDQGA